MPSDAHAYCKALAKQQAKNFYYAFLFLPEPQQQAAFALYAFCRLADDIADGHGVSLDERLAALDRFEADTAACLRHEPVEHPMFVAVQQILDRYELPHEAFFDMIEGMRTDLGFSRFETFAELETYCRQVSSSVAHLLIPVFDPQRHAALRDYARRGGIAVQLTNILRDVREDGDRGRIYLPLEDLREFGVSEQALLSGRLDENMQALMAFEVARAQSYYAAADAALTARDRQRQRVLESCRMIYRRILDEIVRKRYDIFETRVSLSAPHKVSITLGCHLRAMVGF